MSKRKQGLPPSLHSFHESQIPKLVGSLFRDGTAEASSVIYAVTSVQRGEGTTTLSHLIAREAARHPGWKVLLASTSELATLTPDALEHPDRCWRQPELNGLVRIADNLEAHPGPSAWNSDPRFVRRLLELLRANFNAVILDTGALLTSNDVARLSAVIDGAIVVVQADRSTRSQIEHALQILSLAGATLKGFVLNRRVYPIPDRLYRWLRS